MCSVNYFPITKALLLIHLLIYFINCAHWCLSVNVHESTGAWGGQKALDSLELELKAIVSYLVIGSGTQMLVLRKSNKHFNAKPFLQAQHCFFVRLGFLFVSVCLFVQVKGQLVEVSSHGLNLDLIASTSTC